MYYNLTMPPKKTASKKTKRKPSARNNFMSKYMLKHKGEKPAQQLFKAASEAFKKLTASEQAKYK